MKQLDSGKNAEKIKVKLLLSKLKPLHASWLIELYNHFTSTAGKEIIPTTPFGTTCRFLQNLPLISKATMKMNESLKIP